MLRPWISFSKALLRFLTLRFPWSVKGDGAFLARSLSAWLAPITVVLVFCFALPMAGQDMTVRNEVKHDLSPPLSDLVKNAPAQETGPPHEALEVRRLPLPPGFKPAGDPDPALQPPFADAATSAAPTPVAPTMLMNFDGIGQGMPIGFFPCCAPPDTNGAVGLTQYVQWVNLSFAVFDKTTTNMVLGPLHGNTLWFGFGCPCEANNVVDPISLYDTPADRLHLTQLA